MNFNFLKQIIDKCKKYYAKMFILGLSIVFLSIIALLLIYLDYGFFSVAFFMIVFIALPLLLSYQLVCGRIISDIDVNYNEIYKNFKSYFSPIFRGCFSIISSILFAFLISYFLTFIYEMTNINFETLDMTNIDLEVITQLTYDLMNQESYKLFQIFNFGVLGMFFIGRTLSKMPNPYFSYFLGLPNIAIKKVIKQIKTNKNTRYKSHLFTIIMPMILIFAVIYFPLSYIVYFKQNSLSLALLIGISCSLIACSLYLPVYIFGCFNVFLKYRMTALINIKTMLENDINIVLNDKRLNEEQKEQIKKNFENYKKKIDNVESNNEDNN